MSGLLYQLENQKTRNDMRPILIVVLLFVGVMAKAQSFVEIDRGIESDIVSAISASREDGVRYKTFFGLLKLGDLYLDKGQLWKCDSVLTVMEGEFADLIRSGKAHWQKLDV